MQVQDVGVALVDARYNQRCSESKDKEKILSFLHTLMVFTCV